MTLVLLIENDIDLTKKLIDGEFEYVYIKDYNLPLLDEPIPPVYVQTDNQISLILKS